MQPVIQSVCRFWSGEEFEHQQYKVSKHYFTGFQVVIYIQVTISTLLFISENFPGPAIHWVEIRLWTMPFCQTPCSLECKQPCHSPLLHLFPNNFQFLVITLSIRHFTGCKVSAKWKCPLVYWIFSLVVSTVPRFVCAFFNFSTLTKLPTKQISLNISPALALQDIFDSNNNNNK